MGDQNLKLFVDAVFDAYGLGKLVLENKGFSISELAPAEKLVLEVPALIKAASLVKGEVSNLDAAVAADLIAYVGGKLAGESEKAQAIISGALKLADAAYELVKAFEQPSVAAPVPPAAA